MSIGGGVSSRPRPHLTVDLGGENKQTHSCPGHGPGSWNGSMSRLISQSIRRQTRSGGRGLRPSIFGCGRRLPDEATPPALLFVANVLSAKVSPTAKKTETFFFLFSMIRPPCSRWPPSSSGHAPPPASLPIQFDGGGPGGQRVGGVGGGLETTLLTDQVGKRNVHISTQTHTRTRAHIGRADEAPPPPTHRPPVTSMDVDTLIFQG